MGLKPTRQNSDLFCSVLLAIGCTLSILYAVFYFFPLLGHDYSLFFSWVNDYHNAWAKFGVFDVEFSAHRCLGIPVRANPLGVNYSLVHLASLFLNDLGVIVFIVSAYTLVSFWGCLKFLGLFNLPEVWKKYLTSAWVLQGFIFFHVVVGHVGYIAAGLWPLYAYLLLRPGTQKSVVLGVLLLGLLLAHDFHSALTYLFVMFPVAVLVMLIIAKINNHETLIKSPLQRLFVAEALALVLILPKVLETLKFTRHFQRDSSFVPIGIVNSFEYSFMVQFFPFPLDFQKMTGWWYGNWEATNYLFPGAMIVAFIFSVLKYRKFQKTLISFFILVVAGAFISSGAYSDLVKSLPVVKSFHVNPRWMLMLSMGTLVTMVYFFKASRMKTWLVWPFIAWSMLIGFAALDVNVFQISHEYRPGYGLGPDSLANCYEPIFGYRLELFPFEKIPDGKWMDPRCYLVDSCKSFTLPDDKVKDLLEYKLKAFEE